MRTWRLPTISSKPLKAVCINKSLQLPRRPFSTSDSKLELWTVGRILNYSKPEVRERVSLNCWVRTVRKQKKVAFLTVGDGSTSQHAQVVLEPELAQGLSPGTAVHIFGPLKPSPGRGQSHELFVRSIHILGPNDAEKNPLQPKYQTPEYLRTIPHLRPRVPHNATLLRLRSEIIASLTRYFSGKDFVQCHTPIITSSDCEGAGEVFTVSANSETQQSPERNHKDDTDDHFFKTPKYLTVSAQLHLEALASALPKVWTLSPTFRAERSDTPRHLSEFYMLEAEVSFTSDMFVVMKIVEDMLRHVATEVQRTRPFFDLVAVVSERAGSVPGRDVKEAEKALRARWEGMSAANWPKYTYTEAIEKLSKAHTDNPDLFANEPTWDEGFSAEHERYLASLDPTGRPVFITNYPRHQKPFYMSPTPAPLTDPPSEASPELQESSTVNNFDLLVPEVCELAGGSMREHNADALLAAMQEKGVDPTKLEWYMDLRKFGSVPHGGFGLGFDRLMSYLGGEGNLREVVAWPRWVGRCEG
ncbi:hypothetical protein MBLNU230_g1439t2 [Neophaeotheca triangularis]